MILFLCAVWSNYAAVSFPRDICRCHQDERTDSTSLGTADKGKQLIKLWPWLAGYEWQFLTGLQHLDFSECHSGASIVGSANSNTLMESILEKITEAQNASCKKKKKYFFKWVLEQGREKEREKESIDVREALICLLHRLIQPLWPGIELTTPRCIG